MSTGKERDLNELIAEFTRRRFEAKTDAEREQWEKELDEHIARPKLEINGNVEEFAQELEIRLKRASSPPMDMPPEWKEAFGPFFERMGNVPPPDQWQWFSFELWTHYVIRFYFVYGAEPLRALLEREAFWLIAPSVEYFEAARAASDDIERARKTPAFVEAVEGDVDAIVDLAIGRFAKALSYRLGAILNDTLSEITLWALDNIKGELKTMGKERIAQARDRVTEMRDHFLKRRISVEKVRLGTPPPGAPTLTKEEFEALIDEAQAALKPADMDQTKTVVLAYINKHYPAVKCGSVKQLNRLLKKHGLEHKFPVENAGQK